MDFDDALRQVGEWRRYQKQFYLMVSLPALWKGFQVMLVVFTVFVPKHRCAVPGMANDSWDIASEEHRQQVLSAIPSSWEDGELDFDQCHVYTEFNLSSFLFNTSESSSAIGYNSSYVIGQNGSVSSPMMECSRWVYDQSEMHASLITKFDLVCGRKQLRAHSNMMMMAGFLFGSTIASVLCDWLGRKRIYCSCLILMMVFGTASAFPTSPEVLLVFRFLSGTGLMGVMVSGFVLAVEMIGGSMRVKMGAFWQIVWLGGPFLLAALSFVLRDWQQLQLVGSIPPFIFIFYWWLVPESPRWLVSKGRVSEAMVTLTKVAKVNSKILSPSVSSKLQKTSDEALSGSEGTVSPLVIFRHSPLFIRFLIISFNWAVISMTYYGLSLNISNLSGGIRVNFIVSCVVELIGYASATFLLDVFGRKKVHTTSMLTAGLACLLSIFTVRYAGDGNQWITTALASIGKLGVSSSFAVIFIYSAELYPTVLRNFGVGCGSMFARVGSLLSPYIADLALYIEGDFSTAIPLIVFGGMAVAAGLTSLFLPETIHRKLPETVQDAIHFGRTRSTEPEEASEKMTQFVSSGDEEDESSDSARDPEKAALNGLSPLLPFSEPVNS